MHEKLKAVVLTLLAACGGDVFAQAKAVDAAVRKEVVETLAQKLEGDYAVAESGAEMARAIRKKLATHAYDKVTIPDEFVRALQADIRAVANDRHLRVSFDPGAPLMPPPMRRPAAGPGPGAPPPEMLAQMRKGNGEIRRAQILAGNVGYMEVNGVPPGANEAIAATFAFLRNTDALIIDLRGNGGGAPDTVAHYMSYLSEGAPYTVMRVKTRHDGVMETHTTDLGNRSYGAKKPVFVLTSYLTFSGGEEFAYDVQAFKRGKVVGEVTGGGANPGNLQPLGHGYNVFLPFGLGIHPATQTNWEGVGVQPDVPVPAGVALTEAHRLAVQELRVTATDPNERAALDALERQLTSERAAALRAVSRQPLTKAEARLVGVYAPASGAGAGCTIFEKDGQLFLQPPRDKPASRLIPVGGDSYHLEGLPEDFTAAFSAAPDGKVRLLLQLGGWPPRIMEKRE